VGVAWSLNPAHDPHVHDHAADQSQQGAPKEQAHLDAAGQTKVEPCFRDEDGPREQKDPDVLGRYALGERDGQPRTLWSLPFGRRVGEPIIADVDEDGRAEILVPVEDGRLYCLR
jgi:hypothetical protein